MPNKKDALGDRMKENYENRSKTYLPRRVPVMIRIDGKAFHTFTRHFNKPYDEVFHKAMNETLKYLCENIQGCKFGYTQSDEITLVLTDYDTLTTDAWFDYSVQKMCSISASMATMKFNQVFIHILCDTMGEEKEIACKPYCQNGRYDFAKEQIVCNEISKKWENHFKSADKGAMFDARCFSIPESEVVNAIIWRQEDATRNAIQMLGHCHFSNKQLEGKSNDEVQDMLMTQKNINFNDMPIEFKRGVCCIKKPVKILCEDCEITRNKWVIDTEIPIFTQDRDYIERCLKNESNSSDN